MCASLLCLWLARVTGTSEIAYGWVIQPLMWFAAGFFLRQAALPRRATIFMQILHFAAPVAIVVSAYFPTVYLEPPILILIWLYSLVSSSNSIFEKCFGGQFFQAAGKISYSMYMVHYVVFGYGYIMKELIPWFDEHLTIFAVLVLGVVLCSSILLSHFVEEPCNRKMNALGNAIEHGVKNFYKNWIEGAALKDTSQ